MENILFKHLFNYMKTNNILSKCQSGFQPNDSTVNQLIEIYHNIISNMDRGRDVRFVFVMFPRPLTKFDIKAFFSNLS